MFRKKKKTDNFFSAEIEPQCEYCQFYNDFDQASTCEAGLDPATAQPCARFRYDPLKREPSGLPPIHKPDPEEFKLD